MAKFVFVGVKYLPLSTAIIGGVCREWQGVLAVSACCGGRPKHIKRIFAARASATFLILFYLSSGRGIEGAAYSLLLPRDIQGTSDRGTGHLLVQPMACSVTPAFAATEPCIANSRPANLQVGKGAKRSAPPL